MTWRVARLAVFSVVALTGLLGGGPAAGDRQNVSGLPRGMLVQLAGSAGCLAPRQTPLGRRRLCGRVRGLALGANAMVASPDGRHLYVAGGATWFDSAVAVLRRNPRTGAVIQPPGRAGCVGAFDCSPGIGLNGPSALAISPDGRHLLVANPPGLHDLVIYERAARTGALRPVGCVGGDQHSPCPKARVLTRPAAIVVSPDGKNVYVASPDLVSYRGLAIFARSAESGLLEQLEGEAGCIQRRGNGGFGRPCARPVIDAFTPSDVALSPDARHVYVTSGTEIFAFSRDAATGALAPLSGRAACLSQRPAHEVCGRAHLSGESIAVSPDGTNVYVVGDTVAVFRRDIETGQLAQLPRAEACVANNSEARCAGGGKVVISPDGANVYIASGARGVTAYARTEPWGGLVQLPGRAGCYGGRGARCTRARGLDFAGSVAVSPDGRSVYATERFGPPAVAVFRRALSGGRRA